MLKILALLHFLSGLVHNVWSDDEMYRCPDHLSRTAYLKTFQGKCYRFEKTELYWPTARSRCQGEGGDLIQIRNYETQKWVMDTLNELHWGSQDGVWIGAHDRVNEMDWRWVTGERITWSYWGSGQPNCNFFCVEDCGNLRRDDGGRWHDKPCDSFGFVYSFICQYNMKPPTTTTSTTTTTTTPTTTTQPSTTTTQVPTTTITTTTTTTEPSTTTMTTTQPTTTTTTTTTPSTTSSPTTVQTTTPPTSVLSTRPSTTEAPTGSMNNTNVAFIKDREVMSAGSMTGVVIACVLGSVALLLILSVCFFRSRRKEKTEDSLAMHFDNLTYTVRSILSGSRMSRQERHLNNQVNTGSQNVYADPNTCCPTVSTTDHCTSTKEPSHYSEITEAKVPEKLNVFLPKYGNAEYEKCNIAKSKLGGYNDKTAYLEACTYSKNVYDTVNENEASSNAMNELLENSKHQYDECGNVEKGDNSISVVNTSNPYDDLEDIPDSLGSLDNASLNIDMALNEYEEFVRTSDPERDFGAVTGNLDTHIDLTKAPSGYNNNLYDTNA